MGSSEYKLRHYLLTIPGQQAQTKTILGKLGINVHLTYNFSASLSSSGTVTIYWFV